jgi:DNA-binding ferritin-like protein
MWIPHMLNDNQRAMHVLLATTHLQHWRNEGSAFLDLILMVEESWIHSFDTQLK